MFQRILICTDFTDGLYRLVHFVHELATAGLQQITFLHVVPLSEEGIIPKVDHRKVAYAQERLAVALTTVPEGVEVKVEVESGKAVETILRVARTHASDVIVLGTQSRTLLTEKLFGSTLVDLSRQTTIPLLVLRPQLISTYRTEELRLRCQHLFQYLLIPYDDSEPAKYTIEQIKQRVQRQSQKIVEQCLLCWVVRDNPRQEIKDDYRLQESQTTLQRVKTDLEALQLQVMIQVRPGNPTKEILAAAEQADISAIALSSDTLSRAMEWSIASCASDLLRQSWHPILYFPPKSH